MVKKILYKPHAFDEVEGVEKWKQRKRWWTKVKGSTYWVHPGQLVPSAPSRLTDVQLQLPHNINDTEPTKRRPKHSLDGRNGVLKSIKSNAVSFLCRGKCMCHRVTGCSASTFTLASPKSRPAALLQKSRNRAPLASNGPHYKRGFQSRDRLYEIKHYRCVYAAQGTPRMSSMSSHLCGKPRAFDLVPS